MSSDRHYDAGSLTRRSSLNDNGSGAWLAHGKLLPDEGTDEAQASWNPHAHFNLRRGPIRDVCPMRQATTILDFETRRQGLVEITREVNAWVAGAAMREALLILVGNRPRALHHIPPPAAPGWFDQDMV